MSAKQLQPYAKWAAIGITVLLIVAGAASRFATAERGQIANSDDIREIKEDLKELGGDMSKVQQDIAVVRQIVEGDNKTVLRPPYGP